MLYNLKEQMTKAEHSENGTSTIVVCPAYEDSTVIDAEFSVSASNNKSMQVRPIPARHIMSSHPSPERGNVLHCDDVCLRRIIRSWGRPVKSSHATKAQFIPLISPTPYSAELQEALGAANASNIQCMDNESMQVIVFEGIVEYEAYRQFQSPKAPLLHKIIEHAKRNLGIRLCPESTMLHWYQGRNRLQEHGFVALFQRVLTLSRLDALATLASIVSLNFENLFAVHNVTHVAERESDSPLRDCIPRVIDIGFRDANMGVASCMDITEIHGHSGQVIGAVCTYELGRQRFCLPATVVRGQLCIGRNKAAAFLFNQDKIDRHPFATVLLCQDIRLAIALDKRIHESPNLSDSEVIVTGHMGRDLSPIPWNYLAGHDVILLCAPDKECHAQVKAYQNHVAKAGAQSFRVYPFPVLWSKVEKMDGSDAGLISEIEQVLFDKAVALASMAASDLITKLQCEARSYDNYVAWGKKKGLFQSTECHRHDNRDAPTLFSCVTEDCALPHSTTPSLNSLFPKGSISLLHGKKNSGKSFTLLSLAKALCSGSSFHNFECAGVPCKCLLLDSETQPLLLGSRLKQMTLDAHTRTNLHVISKRHEPGGSLWADFDLTRQEHLDALLAHVRNSNIEYVFLDNLTTLVPSGATYQQNTAGLVFDGLKKLCEFGVGVILVHHTLDDPGRKGVHGKMRGSSEFSIRCHTETMVIGKEEVLKEGNAPAVIMERTQQDGALSGLYVKSCKTAAHLENKIFWQHLPLNKSEWQFIATTDITGEIVEESDHAAKKGAERQSSPQTVPDIGAKDAGQVSTHDDTPADTTTLSLREESALAFVRTQKKVTRKQVQSHLAVAEKTAGNTLKVLLEAQLIKKSGSNGDKNTYYYVD
jgi:hypothetical protein